MLGRLAKWLRLLGYDTAYLRDADDPNLARMARAQNRVLLTRDVELTRRCGLRAVLIESERVDAQVRQVLATLNLTPQETFSRCAECNAPLEAASRDALRDAVPPYVFQTQDTFRRCPACARMYWRGTHWARMLATLHDLDLGITKI